MNIRLHDDPLALRLPPPDGAGRRRLVGSIPLDDGALDAFNALLVGLEPSAMRVEADQLVTLARQLERMPPDHAEAVVGERLRRAGRLKRMLDDGDWTLDPTFAGRARRLLAYLDRVDDLIPDDEPLHGLLDDALLVELSWRSFATAAADYADYCRFRAVARPGGDAADRVMAWENHCLAQAALLLRRRQVRAHRYAEGGDLPERFRVV